MPKVASLKLGKSGELKALMLVEFNKNVEKDYLENLHQNLVFNLSYPEKLKRYADGQYTMEVPPVSTTYWTTYDWIQYVDIHGRWLSNK